MSAGGLIKTNTKALRQRIKQDQKANKHLRRHKRYECFAIGILTILDRSVPIDGVVNEISAGGMRFRPASAFILDRKGERVMCTIGDLQVSGKIVAVHPNGYGVQFFEALQEQEIQEMLAEFAA